MHLPGEHGAAALKSAVVRGVTGVLGTAAVRAHLISGETGQALH